MRHIIIGAGAAGISAAGEIRRLRPEDEVVVVSRDDQVHSRCMLHKFLSGERTARESTSYRKTFSRTTVFSGSLAAP